MMSVATLLVGSQTLPRGIMLEAAKQSDGDDHDAC